MEENKAKLIFNMGIGRALLKKGATVIDVKPDHANKDKTVLVFKRDEVFEKAFAEINAELKNKEE